MDEKFNIIANVFEAAVVREATFESRPHLVAPVVLLVEGVHNGFLYEPSEMTKYPKAWDGIPLPIQHPKENGEPISANDPTIIEEQCIGNLFNVRYEADKARLIGEIWVDVDKTTSIAPEVLAALRGGKRLEVSTGLYFDIDPQAGIWNEQQYNAIARNFRPDHLALLPGGVGACSWSDGCGVRANKKEPKPMAVKESLKNRVTALWQAVFSVRENEDSHDELWSKLSSAVSSLDTDSWDHWLREVYDDFIIYQVSGDKNPSEVGSAGTRFLYKRSYTVGADEEVVLNDGVQEVKEEKTYVPVSNDASGDKPLHKEVSTMEPKNEEARKVAIDALVACNCNRFEETDREWLGTLEDAQLDKLRAVDPPPKTDDDPPKPVVNDDDPPSKAEPVTLESYIDAAPSEVGDVLRRAVARDAAEKATVVEALVANTRCKFTKEQLEAKQLNELTTLAELADVPVDFSAAAGAATNVDEDAVPDMPKVFERKKTA